MASSILGPALDDFVGAVLAKPGGKGLDNLDREYIETEVRALKEKVRQYEEAMQSMTEHKQELKGMLSKQEGDQKDIFQYLNGELAKKTDEIVSLEERVLQLEEDNERQLREHETSLQAQQDSAEQHQQSLIDEIHAYKEQLDKVSSFIEYKAKLEADLAEKRKQLEEEAKEHATHVSDLERKHVQEKDRLKKEMLLKLRETKANLLKMTDNQLDTTTKRTIAENEQMSSELAWQSKETEKLIRKNDKLVQENQTLKRELSLHAQTQQEFAKKVHVYQKTIKTLLSKLNTMDSSQRAELQRISYEEEEAQRERAEDQQKIEQLEDELASMRAKVEEMTHAASVKDAAVEELEAKGERLTALQSDAVKFTLQCLEDVHEGMGEIGSGEAEGAQQPQSLSTLKIEEREVVLKYLLAQLQVYQQQLKELELHSQWRNHANLSLPPIPGRGQPLTGLLPPPAEGEVSQWMLAPPAFGGAGADAGYRALPLQPPPGETAVDDLAGDSVVAVGGPVRPWGKRSKELPLTRHTPSSFQRARQGYGGAVG